MSSRPPGGNGTGSGTPAPTPAEVQAAGDRVQALHATKLGLSDQLGWPTPASPTGWNSCWATRSTSRVTSRWSSCRSGSRSAPRADQTALRVRIFPDTVHAESLDPGLTETEVAAGQGVLDRGLDRR